MGDSDPNVGITKVPQSKDFYGLKQATEEKHKPILLNQPKKR